MKKIISLFLQGLLFLAPISITFYILYVAFLALDSIIQETILDWFGIDILGLGFIVLFVLLVIVGLLGQTILARPFNYFTKRVFEKIPLLDFIYSSVSDLFQAFVGKDRKFNKPVIVRMFDSPNSVEKLGFLTDDDLTLIGEYEKVAVYFPHSYNFSGELYIVPKDRVRVINLPPGDVMKYIVSAGVTDL